MVQVSVARSMAAQVFVVPLVAMHSVVERPDWVAGVGSAQVDFDYVMPSSNLQSLFALQNKAYPSGYLPDRASPSRFRQR